MNLPALQPGNWVTFTTPAGFAEGVLQGLTQHYVLMGCTSTVRSFEDIHVIFTVIK